MKPTVCLFFVLALVAQICAIPAEKGDEQAKAVADKTTAEAKDKAKDMDKAVTKEADKVPKDASDAKGKAADAVAEAKRHAGDLTKSPSPQDHAKDCHKPGPHGLGDHAPSKVVKQFEEAGKRMADDTVNFATNWMHMLGL